MAITDFLDLDLAKEDLATTLRVIRQFKKCENEEEFLSIPLAAWAKLEQLQEFLEHKVEGHPLREDTIKYQARVREGIA